MDENVQILAIFLLKFWYLRKIGRGFEKFFNNYARVRLWFQFFLELLAQDRCWFTFNDVGKKPFKAKTTVKRMEACLKANGDRFELAM